ncbi:terminase small subunit [Lactobacillus gasseri]|uniref:terminase small subunit n=1 Tax=Lactobacillus gasseri TaxID=1596 RepID=UPI000763FAA2|nr:terminase small subunit [Lactobacillus gasseri]DAX25157.1 MAG TPA: Terminase small subunit [Bacteriophage sp.]KXA25053.1 terminase small subunit [Lactobacillus gasseri]MCZ3484208.1 terminase small subunit [Lactobacillus gasseri]MCZ3484945.1 terminase small subunit [Lactobacillus gasseri]MCZ3492881.1 terminase small subunit [Lactobacillus gasseri]
MERKLTTKQKVFCDEYIKSGNAKEAAIKAGYSPKTAKSIGQENLTKPDLKAYIDAKMAEIESHKIADAKEVLEFYTKVLRDEVVEEVPMSTADDVVVIKKKPSFKDKITASKEIMKRYPLVDPIEKQKLQKLIADTRISEAKATVAERLGSENTEQLDDLINKLVGEEKKDGTRSDPNS